MAFPRRYGLVALGAAVLTTGSPALAGDAAREKEAAVVTIVPGPEGPTPADVAKLAAAREALAAPAPADLPPAGAPAVLPPVAAKAPEIATIVVGPAGLTSAERAKADAPAAPAPAPAPAAGKSAAHEKE